MWLLRACPRCGGDLYIEQGADHSWFEECLQCSYNKDLNTKYVGGKNG